MISSHRRNILNVMRSVSRLSHIRRWKRFVLNALIAISGFAARHLAFGRVICHRLGDKTIHLVLTGAC